VSDDAAKTGEGRDGTAAGGTLHRYWSVRSAGMGPQDPEVADFLTTLLRIGSLPPTAQTAGYLSQNETEICYIVRIAAISVTRNM